MFMRVGLDFIFEKVFFLGELTLRFGCSLGGHASKQQNSE
jgi:hypothetical protein